MSRNTTVFINKTTTSKTLARSTHEERKLINEQNRARRQPRPCKIVEETENSDKSEVSHSIRHAFSIRPRKSQHKTNDKTFAFVEESPWANIDPSLLSMEQKYSPIETKYYSLLPNIPGNTIDPFQSHDFTVDAELAKILRYYVDVLWGWLWASAQASVDFDLDPRVLKVRKPHEVVATCMKNKARLKTLVAHTACHMQHLGGIKLQRDSLQYVQEATVTMLEEFEAKKRVVDRDMVMHAFHLCAAAIASQQLDAIRIHINGARALIDRIDEAYCGIDARVVALLATIDVEAPWKLLKHVPADERATWLQMATKSKVNACEFDKLIFESGHDFLSFTCTEIITFEVSTTIQSCRQFADSFEAAIKTGEDCANVMRKFSVRNRALYQQILMHDIPDERSKCLLHTILIWIWSANHIGKKISEAAAVQVKDELQKLPMGKWKNHNGLLVWIFLIGALCSEHGTNTQKYFWYQLISFAELHGVLPGNVTDNNVREQCLRRHAQNYLWIEAIQGPLLQELISGGC